MTDTSRKSPLDSATEAVLAHWRDAVPNDRLAHLVREAARGLARSLQLRLSEHGVSFGHWVFLRVLWQHDGLSQRELSTAAGLMEPTTHAALRKMERLGYLTRRTRESDRKRRDVFLTRKGWALRDVLVPLAEDVNKVSVEGVRARDVEITRSTLLTMVEHLAADEQRALEAGLRITATRDLA